MKTKSGKILLVAATATALVVLLIVFVAIPIIKRLLLRDMRVEYPYYDSVEAMTTGADVIVVGDVVEAHRVRDMDIFSDSDKTMPYTLSQIKVTTVIKGGVSVGDIITVKQLGDYLLAPESSLHEIDGYFKKDSSQLLFLCEYDDVPYSTVNPMQGAIEIKDGKLVTKSRFSHFGYKTNEAVEAVIEQLKKLVG